MGENWSFLFVRHGVTESNRDGWLAGSTDVELTHVGLRQAAEAADAIAGEPVVRAFTSPLRRARETAVVIAGRLRTVVTLVPDLAERGWGALERSRLPIDLSLPAPPGGEPIAEFNARVERGLAFCRKRADGQPFLIVSHAGVFRALCDIFRIPADAEWVDNAAPVRFRFSKTGWAVNVIDNRGQ